jgi:hypothetical protein
MMYGSGGMGTSSIETLTKDLRRRLSDPNDQDYYLDPAKYTIEEVALKARRFFFEECYPAAFQQPPADFMMGYRVGGYGGSESLAEVREFLIAGASCDQPSEIQGRGKFGVRWAGENEALDRLILGSSSKLTDVLVARGMTQADAEAAYMDLINAAAVSFVMSAMPIQDAIDVARYLVETASRFTRYGLRPETIGGPIEIAAITKYEGFKWISRKHYYKAELNPESRA